MCRVDTMRRYLQNNRRVWNRRKTYAPLLAVILIVMTLVSVVYSDQEEYNVQKVTQETKESLSETDHVPSIRSILSISWNQERITQYEGRDQALRLLEKKRNSYRNPLLRDFLCSVLDINYIYYETCDRIGDAPENLVKIRQSIIGYIHDSDGKKEATLII